MKAFRSSSSTDDGLSIYFDIPLHLTDLSSEYIVDLLRIKWRKPLVGQFIGLHRLPETRLSPDTWPPNQSCEEIYQTTD